MTADQCADMVHGRVSIGVMSRGRESTVPAMPHRCPHPAIDGPFCARHAEVHRRIETELQRRRRAT